eukprot:scaffold4372_cov397-Prasinococcus_capsulatus_cf.AAC.46
MDGWMDVRDGPIGLACRRSGGGSGFRLTEGCRRGGSDAAPCGAGGGALVAVLRPVRRRRTPQSSGVLRPLSRTRHPAMRPRG